MLSYGRALSITIICALGISQGTGSARAEILETARLRIHFEEDVVSTELAEAAGERGEALLTSLVERLGPRYAPPHTIHVLLHGPAQGGDYPRVDSLGRVHLYQFGPDAVSHLSPLAHELVHVLRNPHVSHWNGFLEEGFASYVALDLEPKRPGFPFYGAPVHVVAGQWLGGDEEIPLVDLAADHRKWNLACKTQSYTLRASFFDYLGRTYGDEAVLAFADASTDTEQLEFEKHFGSSLVDLAAAWRDDLWNRYAADPGAAEASREYRAGPAKWTPPCKVSEQK